MRNVLRASSSALRFADFVAGDFRGLPGDVVSFRGAERTIAFSELGGRSRLRLRGSREGDRLR